MSRKKHKRTQGGAMMGSVSKNSKRGAAEPAVREESGSATHRSTTRGQRRPRRHALLIIAVLLAASAIFFFVRVLPVLRLRSEIPAVPDLTGKADSFIKEVRDRDQSVRGLKIDGDKLGELGKFYQANVYPKEAERCYEIAARLSPGNPRWPYYRAYLRQQQGRVDGVGELLSRVADLSPDYIPARLKSADIRFKSGETAEAEGLYLQLVDDKDVGPHACLGLARIRMDAGRWDEARATLEKALDINPGFKPACRMMAAVYDHFGKQEESEIFRERAGIERFAEAPDPWIEELADLCFIPQELMRLANISLQTSKYERAFGLYKRAVDLDPGNADNILQVGQMVFDSGNREASLSLFENALALRPNDEMALFYIGLTHSLQNRLDDAERTFRKLLEVNPASTDGWTGLGDIEFKRLDYRSAGENYKKAMEADPRSSKAAYAMGRVEAARGNTGAALSFFRKAADLDPRSADALFSIGAVLAQTGATEEAIVFYKKALSENPEFALAHYNLANAFFRSGKFDEARERYRRVIECDPEIAEAYLNLAGIFSREGKTGEARQNLEKALSLAESQGNQELKAAIQAEIDKLR